MARRAGLSVFVAALLLSACQGAPRAAGAASPPADPPAAAAATSLDQIRGLLGQHDYARALALLEPLAKQGDPKAQALLARVLGFGPKEQRSPAEAVGWAEAAAQKGDAEGEEVLGWLTLSGVGVARDAAVAAEWFRRAAEQDNVAAAQELGLLYTAGTGVGKDAAQAVKWTVRAAERGNPVALATLGEAFSKGEILPLDPRQAFFWYSVALPRLADQSGPSSVTLRERDKVAIELNFDDTRALMLMAQNWVPAKGSLEGVLAQAGKKTTGPALRGTGSGFAINEAGDVLTARHVVKDCKTLTVTPAGGTEQPAQLVATDEPTDLALIRRAPVAGPVAPLHDLSAVRQGEMVLAAGYPLSNVLGAELNTTIGTVSALSGWKKDHRGILFSAPISPGNSGGPLLDASGAVIGVVQAQLDNLVLASVAGIVSQNVNFAAGGEAIRAFLDGHKIGYRQIGQPRAQSPVELSDQARRYTLLVACQS